MSLQPNLTPKSSVRRSGWLKRLMAIIALINLLLVFFNLSYIPNRLFYWQISPELIELYDPVRGIQPHPETQRYLNTVDQLELIQGDAPEAEALLGELRFLSNQMREENPFTGASRSSILEKIKQDLCDRVGVNTAQQAFETFWSQAYLNQAGWQAELAFFDTEIRPLLETNYYRDINRFGKFVDRFWLLDLPFIVLFGLDFLIRSFFISRRNPQLNWLEAMLRRWYDLFLLIPLWRWLRVLPVLIRLYQARLLNLEPFRAQINHDFTINFAEDISQVIGVRVIDQLQESIAQGEVAQWLFHREHHSYVTVNDVDEIKAIASRLVKVSVYDVLPQIQPDLEALLHYSLQNSLNQVPTLGQLRKLPGVGNLANEIAQNLAHQLSGGVYQNLTQMIEDPTVAKLSDRLFVHFREALDVELQKKPNLGELESLLIDMLEEIKINYVKGLAPGGVEKIKQEADQLQYGIQPPNQLALKKR